jgi:hypothetical protein
LLARGELRITGKHDDNAALRDRDNALAAFGLAPATDGVTDDDGGVFYLWPEHVHALELWAGVQTQWRTGHEGNPTGLDYSGVRASPALRRLPRSRREAAFADVCIMERAWLEEAARR